MPPHNGEVPYEKRVGVIALRLLIGLPFCKVAEKLDLAPRTTQVIYSRALERTEPGLRESFVDVARNVKNAPRTGRPPLANASSRLRNQKGTQRDRKSRSQAPKSSLQQGVESSHIVNSVSAGQPTLVPRPELSNASWERPCNRIPNSGLSIIPYVPPVPKSNPNKLVA